jgi:RNA polymerase sigma factor (sigma-70 family)
MYQEQNRYSEVQRLATQLYAEKRSYLLSIAYYNATNEADAEEALQEAFVSFIRQFDPDRGAPPLAWLTLTLKRQCWRQRRECYLDRYAGQEARAGGEEPGFVLDSIPSRAPSPERGLIERDDARRRLGRLKPDERAALLLHASGFSYEEIGQGREWTQTKVKRCIYEGRAALRGAAAVASV